MSLWLDHPAAQALAWALVHALWQGALVGLLAALGLRALRFRSPQARYLLGCAALLLMLALPAGTFAWLLREAVPLAALPMGAGEVTVRLGAAPAPELSQRLRPLLPWVLQGWLAGVLVMALRLAGGWVWVVRLRWLGAEPAERAWQSRLADLQARLGVDRPVRLLRSTTVTGPLVLGWLRPAILVPAAAFAGVDPRALEVVLAHELAHVRRQDYLVNLLQSVVEVLLFYHPAAWWLSAQIRAEREHCCDDAAVALCGDRVFYARALASLEALRQAPSTHPKLAPAATGGPLMSRIRRLLLPTLPPSPAARAGLVAALAVSVLGAATGLSIAPSDPPKAPEAPTARAEEKEITVVVRADVAKAAPLKVRMKGKVKVQPEATPQVLLEEDGASLDIEGKDGEALRRYLAERAAGTETRQHFLDGKALAPNPAAEAWLKAQLAQLKKIQVHGVHLGEGGHGVALDHATQARITTTVHQDAARAAVEAQAKALEAKAKALEAAQQAKNAAEVKKLQAELNAQARQLAAEAKKLSEHQVRVVREKVSTDPAGHKVVVVSGAKEGKPITWTEVEHGPMGEATKVDVEVKVDGKGQKTVVRKVKGPDGKTVVTEDVIGPDGPGDVKVFVDKDGKKTVVREAYFVKVDGGAHAGHPDPKVELEALKKAQAELQRRIDDLQKEVEKVPEAPKK